MGQYTFEPQDVDPLLEGLAILGTGGGGSPAWGRAIMEQELRMGRRMTIISPEDIDDDATVVSGGIMGSVKALEAMGFEEVMQHWEESFALLQVTRVMEKILGRRIDHVVPFEVGGLNTPVILSLGARAGFPIIDGDALGRSAPETQMTSFIGHGISLTPMPLIDYQGNVVIVKEAADPAYPDELGRWVVTKGGGLGANNHYPMSGKQLKESVIPHTISQALELGRAVIRAREDGRDAVQVAADLLGGKQLFLGRIESLQEEERIGFYFTGAHLVGTGPYKSQRARLVIKNETMVLFIDREVKVIFPDLVCMLDPISGRGLMSVELEVGTSLALVGAPCHSRLREALASEVGAKAFSPARFGHPELTYQPIEELMDIR